MTSARIAFPAFLLIVVIGSAAAQPRPKHKTTPSTSKLLDQTYCSAWEKAKEQFGVKLLNLIGDPARQRTALEVLDIGPCPRATPPNSMRSTPPEAPQR
jgi:hypothetical protein